MGDGPPADAHTRQRGNQQCAVRKSAPKSRLAYAPVDDPIEVRSNFGKAFVYREARLSCHVVPPCVSRLHPNANATLLAFPESSRSFESASDQSARGLTSALIH